MLRKIILAVIVAVIITVVLELLGSILVSQGKTDPTALLPTIGDWLKHYGGLIGLCAGLWYYFAGGSPLAPRA